MLTGIRIYSSDVVWRNILADLNAVVLDAPDTAEVNLDDISLEIPISALDLKAVILSALDNTKILQDIFGKAVYLPQLQAQIVVWLYKTGGLSLNALKKVLGYMPNMTTHAVDTAIYQLRKNYGKDFIQNKNGVYIIGKL